jgi:chromosome segregation ATPase
VLTKAELDTLKAELELNRTERTNLSSSIEALNSEVNILNSNINDYCQQLSIDVNSLHNLPEIHLQCNVNEKQLNKKINELQKTLDLLDVLKDMTINENLEGDTLKVINSIYDIFHEYYFDN